MTQAKPHVLIVGASGLVGSAAANSFLAAGWSVTTSSRRRSEWIEHSDYEHLTLDLQDTQACANAAQQLPHITHVVYTAVFELPGLIDGWSDERQIQTNGQMLANLLEPLSQAAELQHVTLLQGTKAYGGAVQPMRVPARESQPRVPHANFYWVQEDYLSAKAAQAGFAFTILRPQLIVGPNYGVVMNLPPVVGAFAAIRAAENKPFGFPGGPDWVWEAVDARLVGNACLWAAEHSQAHGETFNLTNGEVFMWRDMWPAIAQTLGVEAGADEPLDIAAYLSDREDVWQSIVQRHDLRPLTLAQLLGESHHYANLCFAYGASQAPPPTFVSTIKIKQAGFTETMHSEASFCHWLQALQAQRVIPTAAQLGVS